MLFIYYYCSILENEKSCRHYNTSHKFNLWKYAKILVECTFNRFFAPFANAIPYKYTNPFLPSVAYSFRVALRHLLTYSLSITRVHFVLYTSAACILVYTMLILCFRGSCGLWMDEDLYRGRTQCCDTFSNDPLTGDKEDFIIKSIEVWSFNELDDFEESVKENIFQFTSP